MSRVLLPLAVLEGETVSLGLLRLLGTVDVTVLGYYVPPDQTSAAQARNQFGERARSTLDDVIQEFQQAGGDAEYRLVFTHDRQQTIRRVAEDIDARAIVTTGATGNVDRLLVSLSGDVDVEGILSFVRELIGDRRIAVTLLATGRNTDTVQLRLDEAESRLSAAGIDVTTQRKTGAAFTAIVDTVSGHDAVVIGEDGPSLSSLVFGDEPARIAATTVSPVLVVRSNRVTNNT